MRTYVRDIESIEIIGGYLCLDFVNTVRTRNQNPLVNYLLTPHHWTLWLERVRILEKSELSSLKKYIRQNPEKAEIQLKEVINTREILFKLLSNIAKGGMPPKSSLARYNKLLTDALKQIKIFVNEKQQIEERWNYNLNNVVFPLNKILKSSYELITSDNLSRLKECSCGWLYYDLSKNKSRRWCSMETCGSSKKASKYYRKMKEQKSI